MVVDVRGEHVPQLLPHLPIARVRLDGKVRSAHTAQRGLVLELPRGLVAGWIGLGEQGVPVEGAVAEDSRLPVNRDVDVR